MRFSDTPSAAAGGGMAKPQIVWSWGGNYVPTLKVGSINSWMCGSGACPIGADEAWRSA